VSFELEFYEDEYGDEPVLRWLREDLTPMQRRAIGVLRVFCHAYGDRIVLLLGGFDKGADPSAKRQQGEIDVARKRLADFRRRSGE
jgi:phage-related protein